MVMSSYVYVFKEVDSCKETGEICGSDILDFVLLDYILDTWQHIESSMQYCTNTLETLVS